MSMSWLYLLLEFLSAEHHWNPGTGSYRHPFLYLLCFSLSSVNSLFLEFLSDLKSKWRIWSWMDQANALRSVLCWLNATLNLLPKYSGFLNLTVKLVLVFWPLEKILWVFLPLIQSTWTNISPFKSLIEWVFWGLALSQGEMRKDSVPQFAAAITTRDQDNTVQVLVQAAHIFGREINEKKRCSWSEWLNVVVTLWQWEWLWREKKKQKGKSDFKSIVAKNIRMRERLGQCKIRKMCPYF